MGFGEDTRASEEVTIRIQLQLPRSLGLHLPPGTAFLLLPISTGPGQSDQGLKGETIDLRDTSLAGLTPLERRTLDVLLNAHSKGCTFAELYDRAWGRDYYGDLEPVRALIKRLRRKLREIGSVLEIESLRGYGYRAMPQVARPPIVEAVRSAVAS
jgi:DNA-binding response OmpR family regulator